MNEAQAVDGVSAGTLLREAREAAGLHVDTLAANLKVPVRKLEALEQDRYDLLPDAVFARALASSVCRTLKLDPQPVLGRLPQTTQVRLVPETEGINEPFRSPGDGGSPGLLAYLGRPVVLVVSLLLLGALVLVFLPMVQKGYEVVMQANGVEPVMPPSDAATAPAGETVAAEPASPATEPATSPEAAAPNLTVPPAPSPPATSTTPQPPAVAAPGAAPQPVAETPALPVPSDAVVVFRTRGPSWIQVTDARGNTVLRRLMAAGESAGTGGALPLSVTIGDAAQTDVLVRGKPYSLAPLARDNVARFEVK